MTCDKIENMRDLFTAAVYDELDAVAGRELDNHLASCETCRREYRELKEALALMDMRSRVEPSEQEWMDFDRRLDEQLSTIAGTAPGEPQRKLQAEEPVAPQHARPKPRPVGWLPSFSPAWGYGIAAAFLLAIGFFVGRTFFFDTGLIGTGGDPGGLTVKTDATGTSDGAGTPGRADETFSPKTPGPSGGAATVEALDYLERSRNLLIGLTNLDERQAGSIDLRRQQEVSRELYDTGNTLTVALSKPSQQQLRQLVQQLQIILLQLSNAGLNDGRPVVEIVRQGLDSRSILLKINLEAIRATLQETAVRPTDRSKTNL